MEEPQARVRAMRALKTEQNLARQPKPPSALTADGTVVPLPTDPMRDHIQTDPFDRVDRLAIGDRSLEDTPSSTPAPSPSGRRKSSSRRKPVATFRQLWETNQQLVSEELQRLELQAERINHLLAERAKRRGQTTSTPLAGRSSPIPQLSLTTPSDPNLQAQTERINQILEELQTALANEATAIAPISSTPTSEPEPSPQPPAAKPTAPQESDRLSSLDLPPLSRDTTEAMRYLTYRSQVSPDNTPHNPWQPERSQNSWQQDPWQQNSWQQDPVPPAVPATAIAAHRSTVAPASSTQSSSTRSSSGRVAAPVRSTDSPSRLRPTQKSRSRSAMTMKLPWRLVFQVPQKPVDRVGNAVVWILGAMLLRWSSQMVLGAAPVLAPVFGLLMLAPTAIAVFLALCIPQTSAVLIYRLFLLTLGLLLGGRL